MQATIISPTEFNPLSRLQFARSRGYMMRSEKRGSEPSRGSASGGRPPRRRRRRAGFFYKLLMLILLLTVWPLGLLMLWRRKVRWGVGTKLLTSVVTLAACVILIGFALTVDTGNPRYTAIQDNVNSFLDKAADTLVDFGDIASEKAELVFEGVTEFGEALWEAGRVHLSNGIDAGIAFTQSVKNSVVELLEKPEATPAPADADETEAPEAGEDAQTDAPEAGTAGDEADELPVYLPGEAPDAADGAPVEDGTLTRAGTLEDAEPQAEPTPRPTLEPLKVVLKPAAEATVYYNDGGKCYHMAPSCGSMTNAAEHKFGETAEISNRLCTLCNTPDKALLEEEYIVWTDENSVAHLSDECEAFTGGWQLMSAAQALEQELPGCEECSSDLYLRAVESGLTIVLEAPEAKTAEAEPSAEEPAEEEPAMEEPANEEPAAEEPAVEEPAEAEPADEETANEEPVEEEPAAAEAPAEAEPSAEPSAQPATSPAVQTVSPKVALKPAGEATVYHSTNGKWYHTFNRCSGMTGGGAYTLAECAQTHKQCRACGAPDAAYIDQNCLWADENGLCHTSDGCEAFQGKYSLVPRDEALNQGAKGCAACGADEYLIPGTEVNYPEYVQEAA